MYYRCPMFQCFVERCYGSYILVYSLYLFCFKSALIPHQTTFPMLSYRIQHTTHHYITRLIHYSSPDTTHHYSSPHQMFRVMYFLLLLHYQHAALLLYHQGHSSLL
uniref:Uncharacterized protein n=1 Tax=Cacopsylla melanoneura TaxID=428564 RepID=A0A8D8X3G2_9HEMI